ncbi:hypothetical protein GME_16312 [Halomonas sp. TD01]|nr:hypothetical protein GME_16312 [Halomonas sp. TD01]
MAWEGSERNEKTVQGRKKLESLLSAGFLAN